MQKAIILVIDDDPANIEVLNELLGETYDIIFAINALQVFRLIQKIIPDLILLDIILPDMDGYDICKHLKTLEITKNIPVLFITGLNDTLAEIKGLEVGGIDYITKPFNPEIVKVRVRNHLELKQMQDKLLKQTIELTESNLQIQEKEERLALALAGSSDGLWDWNLETDEVYFSPAWKSMLGYAENELENNFTTWVKLIHPEDLPQATTYLNEFLTKKRLRYENEFRMIHKNGEHITILARAIKQVNDQTNKVVRLAGTHVDITKIRKAEEQIRMLSVAMEQNPANIVITNTSGNIEYINPSFTNYTGYSLDEVKGKNPRIIKSGKTNPKIFKELWETITDGKTWKGELINKKKNGDEFIENTVIAPIFDNNQKIINYIAIKEDITARKLAEEALKESEEKFKNLIREMHVGVLLQGPQAEILMSNPKALELLGLTEDQLMGKTSFDSSWNVIHEDGSSFPGTTHPVPQAIETRNSVRGIVMGVYRPTKEDRVWLLVDAVPQFKDDGTVIQVVCTFIDITGRKQAEQSLKESEQRLAEIINFLPDATLVIDENGKVLYWNNVLEEMTGVQAKDMIGKGDYEYAIPFYGERRPILIDLFSVPEDEIKKNYFNVRKEGKILRAETYVPYLQKGVRYTIGTASPLYDYNGKFVGAIEIFRDITEQKDAEIKILEQQKELEISYRELEQEKKNAEDAKGEVEKLNEFTRIINSTPSISSILKEIYTYIHEKNGFDFVWIVLVNKKRNRIFSESSLSIFESQEKFDSDFFNSFNKKLDESLGIIYHTYKARVPFYCSDITRTKRTIMNDFNGHKYKIKKIDILIQRKGTFKSLLQFPLVLQNEVIGILNLSVHNKIIQIGKQDIDKMMRFADQIAGVINNAHLLEESEEAQKEAELEQRIAEFAQRETEEEKAKSEKLLLNILPEEIALELKEKGSTEPVFYNSVSVLFTDFEGFTKIAENLSPNELVSELNSCFSYFDSLMETYNLEKLKTIGDSYMCAGGIPVINKTHPIDSVLAALEIQAFMKQINSIKKDLGDPYWELRLGIHTGPLVAGVLGLKKFAYDVWGETVNTASRMESSGTPGMVNISSATYMIVKDFFECEYRGKVQAKNQGEVEMYYVTGIKKDLSINSDCKSPSPEFWLLYDKIKND